ncbi:MAG: hypothetical protein IPJ01_12465 [Micavibrio sp.]|nr:hypothetical protein [Micavibrio sp.]
MIKKVNEINKAIKLREKGFSINAISKELKVSKGSVSAWVKNVTLTDKQKLILKNNSTNTYLENLHGQSEKNKSKYEKIRLEYRNDGFLLASNNEYFRKICLLYWAEGSKSKNGFVFCNSDMDMMNLVCYWLDKNILDKNITFRVNYYGENGLNEYQIKRRWIKIMPFLKKKKWIVKLKKQELRRDSQKRGIGKLLYGTASVIINSTKLIQGVYGGIKYIKENIGD